MQENRPQGPRAQYAGRFSEPEANKSPGDSALRFGSADQAEQSQSSRFADTQGVTGQRNAANLRTPVGTRNSARQRPSGFAAEETKRKANARPSFVQRKSKPDKKKRRESTFIGQPQNKRGRRPGWKKFLLPGIGAVAIIVLVCVVAFSGKGTYHQLPRVELIGDSTAAPESSVAAGSKEAAQSTPEPTADVAALIEAGRYDEAAALIEADLAEEAAS